MEAKDRIIVALDVASLQEAMYLVDSLYDKVGMFKIGLELFCAVGPEIIDRIRLSGSHDKTNRPKVFVDLALISNPDTLAKSVRAITNHQPDFISIHAMCGEKGMLAAMANKGNSKLLATTVLTGFTNEQCFFAHGNPPSDKVFQFALLAVNSGLDGILCAPTQQELGMINDNERLRSLIKVAPAIRPSWANHNDQHRTATPAEAILRGADYLVIGRPITDPAAELNHSPELATQIICEEIREALVIKEQVWL